MHNIAANIKQVQQRINRAAARTGRNPADITLVAVTKTHPLETVIAAYQAGLRHFGENRSEEGGPKVDALTDWLAGDRLEPPVWHFIGHLQSRKVGDVLGRYPLIHSVDSLKLAERINRLAERDNHPPVEILLECNVSGEAAKYGFNLNHWQNEPDKLKTFIETVRQIETIPYLKLNGLMTMAPIVTDPEQTRPVFKSLAQLFDRLKQELPQFPWQHLSMGMTDDFEVAIEEGATIVRVGRALFGERGK